MCYLQTNYGEVLHFFEVKQILMGLESQSTISDDFVAVLCSAVLLRRYCAVVITTPQLYSIKPCLRFSTDSNIDPHVSNI